jgi:lysylphosphatidylglycerol synthetase-like protein (DUF2156 family)
MALLTPSERAQLHEIWLLALVMLVLTAAAAVAACLAAARSLPEVQGWVVTCRSGRNVTRNAAWRVMTPFITRNAPEQQERYAASCSLQLQLVTHPA